MSMKSLKQALTTQQKYNSRKNGIAYGRQFEVVPGEEIQFDFSALAGTRYIVIYLEIDLRDPTNETASLKATYSDSAYPEITEGDNLISSPNGLYRMLFHVIKTSSTTTITPMFKVLLSDKIKSSIFSEEAEHADDASTVNGIEINALSGKLITKCLETPSRILKEGSLFLMGRTAL